MLAGLFLLLAAGCAPKGPAAPPAPREGRFPPGALLQLEDGRLHRITDSAFQGLAAMADYVLLGEGHTVACDHEVQGRLLELLASDSRQWAVGLEMMGADQQSRLDAVNRQAKQLLRDLPRLEQELDWQRNWGYGFELYAPVLQAALRNNMPLFALNVPKGLLKELRRKGRENLTKEQQQWLPQDIIPPMEEQRESLRQVFSMHQEFMKGEAADEDVLKQRLERFFLVQSIWDTAMALRAWELHQRLERPVAVIAGSGHVENGWGIAHRLETLQPGARVLLVVPWRGGRPPKARLGDVFYHCPEAVTTKQGLTLAWIPESDASDTPEGGFALVREVADGSLAAEADLRPGDAILEARGRRLGSLGGLHLAAITASRKGEEALQLLIRRNGYRLLLELPLPDAPSDESK